MTASVAPLELARSVLPMTHASTNLHLTISRLQAFSFIMTSDLANLESVGACWGRRRVNVRKWRCHRII